jgi:Cys-tRNA(Pro)/Cys-tRNA(Cys) deacylase
VTLPALLYLQERGIPYQAAAFAPDTPKGAAAVARALGFPEGAMVKTLVFETGAGEAVLVMVGGDRSAISGHLKRAVGSRDVRLASPARVKETTGYEIGSVPPFHWQPAGFRSFLDAALLAYDRLGVGAGVWGNEILISPRELVAASHAVVANLTDPSRPAGLMP